MCSECAKALRIQSNKCPICRQSIEELIEIKLWETASITLDPIPPSSDISSTTVYRSSSPSPYLFSKMELHVLILGIDKAGKTTLLEKMKSMYSNIEGIPPDRIIPTVGLNIGRIEVTNSKLVFWDLGGQLAELDARNTGRSVFSYILSTLCWGGSSSIYRGNSLISSTVLGVIFGRQLLVHNQVWDPSLCVFIQVPRYSSMKTESPTLASVMGHVKLLKDTSATSQ
ncbi:hypothetical protein V8G54_032843 [Vigna mungo]|uniref:Uncharacterized protein n=1 Tax=Vigna mungo TaxID=3915 RepID=A0AAQ3MMQ3_VIGMU